MNHAPPVLTEAERESIRAIVAAHTATGAARVLRLPRAVVLGAAAGAEQRAGSVHLIRAALAGWHM